MPRSPRQPMRNGRTSQKRAVAAWLAVLALGSAAVLLLGGFHSAHAASIGQLQQQIGAAQGKVSNLSGQVGAVQSRLSQLNGNIASLQGQISSIQADLDTKRARLIKLEEELNAARARLAQLQAEEVRGEQVLQQQVVGNYESDHPDLVGVVLESNGFTDLLEQLSFANRIQKQNTRIVARVRRDRRAVASQAIVLGSIEVRQQRLTEQVLHERNRLDGAKVNLIRQRIAVVQVRDAKAGQLSDARGQLSNLQNQLNQAQAAQASQSSSSGGAPATSGAPAGSANGFTFPLPKDAASPPGTWSQDQGVDISAPGDTPEFAVCSGTIVLHGIGGFGPDAPVLHCDSPIDGNDYVYYGHAGPANQLPIGTHVGAGQVMSSVGPGIVGISTGPHLEIGFCDSSGSPNGGAAGTMMSLLNASY